MAMSIELSDLCKASGLNENVLQIQNVKLANKLRELQNQKHMIFAIDKIKCVDGYVVIFEFKKDKDAICFYFKNKATATNFYAKARKSILNIKA